MKKIFGLSRNRDEHGMVVKRNLHNYVNCIHASVGGGYENMWVLVLEVYDRDKEPAEGIN